MSFTRSLKILFVLPVFVLSAVHLSLASDVNFSWSLSNEPEVIGYRIYYRMDSEKNYKEPIDITPSLYDVKNGRVYTTLSEFNDNQTYYFSVTSYSMDLESGHSPEIKHTTETPNAVVDMAQSQLIPQSHWSLQYVDSEELVGSDGAASNVFDGNINTIWHTEWKYSDPLPPHELQIDLGAEYSLNGFRYLPRQDGNINGTISQFHFYVSADGVNWGAPVAEGTFNGSTSEQEVLFPKTVGRYVSLVALNEINNKAWSSVAELNLLGEL